MLARITKAYKRHYTDSGQTVAYVEWLDTKGRSGRTEGQPANPHMVALFARAKREGITPTSERW